MWQQTDRSSRPSALRTGRTRRGVKSFERRAAELRRRPPSTFREQALADLDAGVRRDRERVALRISDAEFRRRRDGQGLAELTRVEGERGAGAQHAGL